MPLPSPKPFEREEQFIPRCVAEVLKKGEADDARQATAICYTQLQNR